MSQENPKKCIAHATEVCKSDEFKKRAIDRYCLPCPIFKTIYNSKELTLDDNTTCSSKQLRKLRSRELYWLSFLTTLHIIGKEMFAHSSGLKTILYSNEVENKMFGNIDKVS